MIKKRYNKVYKTKEQNLESWILTSNSKEYNKAMTSERYSRKPGTGTTSPTTNTPQNPAWESAGYGHAQISMKRTRHSLHRSLVRSYTQAYQRQCEDADRKTPLAPPLDLKVSTPKKS